MTLYSFRLPGYNFDVVDAEAKLLKLLLVEDDRDIAALIKQWMEAERISIDVAYDGLSGFEYLRQGHYDAVILDWSLPGLSGIDILNRYRAGGGTTPVLMLTAHSLIEQKVTGFESGVDDYLTKPFHVQELYVRVKALAKRPRSIAAQVLKVADIELDSSKHRLIKAGQEIHLQPREFQLLEFLMSHPDEIFSSESLLQRVWGLSADVSLGSIRTAIRRIRQALGENADDEGSIIENVRRVGYRLRVK